MTFYGGVQDGTERSDWILGVIWVFVEWMSKTAPYIIVAACPEWGTGNYPEALKLAFHQGPTFINAYFQATTNLVDQDSGVSNDLLWPRRSALSKYFT